MNDSKVFLVEMNRMALVYNHELTKELLSVYFDALVDMSAEEFVFASAEHIKRSRFFPKPSELLDIKREADKKRRAEEKSPRFHIAITKTEEERAKSLEIGNKKLQQIKGMFK